MSAFFDDVGFTAASSGTADFVFSARVAGYNSDADANMATGPVAYRAFTPGNAQFEIGVGTYTSGTRTITRTTVYYNSSQTGTKTPGQSGAGTKISFSVAPNVVIVALSQDLLGIDQSNSWNSTQQLQARTNLGIPTNFAPPPTGTAALFVQTSAPTGWTKSTTHNDKALRVVSGTASSGGTNSFSTVMAQTVVGSTTLTLSQIPAINPSVSGAAPNDGCYTSGGGGSYVNRVMRATNLNSSAFSTTFDNFGWSTPGGGGSHNHTITMAMQYVDVIIATKD